MKKIAILVYMFFYVLALNAEPTIEFGPRIGHLSFDDEKLGKGFAYGFQTSYYINSNQRIRVTYDMFEGDNFKQTEIFSYETTWEERSNPLVLYNEAPYVVNIYESSIITQRYYLNWIKSFDTETKPLFCEYNYLFNLTNWMFSLGAGLGMAMNDISADYYFNARSPEAAHVAQLLNNTISTEADLDNNFIYGFTGSITYNGIWENLTFELQYQYITGEADGEIVTRNQGVTTTEEFELDTTATGIYLSANLSF